MDLIESENEGEQEGIHQPEIMQVPSFVTPHPVARSVSYEL